MLTFFYFCFINMRNIFFFRSIVPVISIVFLFACTRNNNNNLRADISDVEIKQVKIGRYEKALFSLNPDSLKTGLKSIAPRFQVFLAADLDDTLNLIQIFDFITSPLNLELFNQVINKYPNLDILSNKLTKSFKYFSYHFPEKHLPDVYSYVSGLIFEQPVKILETSLIIALDMYLGKDFGEYKKLNLPNYKLERMNKNYIVRDCMDEIYFDNFYEAPPRNFLEAMIKEGKRLYFLDAVLPDTPDFIKIGYTPEQINWCEKNENNIWAFFIENELLFSSNALSMRKFFIDGPFTSSFSKGSPARIGAWTGWQIIREYKKNNPEISLEELLKENDAQKILKDSKYKPRQ